MVLPSARAIGAEGHGGRCAQRQLASASARSPVAKAASTHTTRTSGCLLAATSATLPPSDSPNRPSEYLESFGCALIQSSTARASLSSYQPSVVGFRLHGREERKLTVSTE